MANFDVSIGAPGSSCLTDGEKDLEVMQIKAARIKGIDDLQSCCQSAQIHDLSLSVRRGMCRESPYVMRDTESVTYFAPVIVPRSWCALRCQALRPIRVCKERIMRANRSSVSKVMTIRCEPMKMKTHNLNKVEELFSFTAEKRG